MSAGPQRVEPRPLPPATARRSRRRLRAILPLAVLAVAVAGAGALLMTRPRVHSAPPAVLPPLVRVLSVEPEDVELVVRAQGTVEPRTESDLVAEVAGRVTWISPALAAGGFFDEGEPLLRLDPRDYDVALERAAALVARRESEAALAERNLERGRRLAQQGALSEALLDDAQSAARVAAAALRDARAGLAQARLDRERSELRAPFAGRVREARVDVGQFVARGQALARLYSVDYAEVRLPIPDDELAHLDLSLDHRTAGGEAGPQVVLRARLAGREFSWPGRVVRTEAEIDPRSRMVHMVARVEDPYGRSAESPERPPLPVGLFVDAEIQGRRVDAVYRIPRAALRPGGRVFVADAEDRLRFREVELVRLDRDVAVVQGLDPAERVVLSPLEAVTDGMALRTVSDRQP